MRTGPQPPYDTPMEGQAVDGEVAITGPGRLAGSLTPEAARRSAEALTELADQAEGQPGAAPDDDEAGGPADQDEQTSSSEP
ncbi:hypothetical protein [Phenylobacterium sp.]|uniref:hypothetical protein n=1 Tax=Phenylobacterium sp. TaxID=1871053 RepID=UPI002F9275DB